MKTLSKVIFIFLISIGFLSLTSTDHIPSKQIKQETNYKKVIITLSFENGEFLIKDSQGNPFDSNNPEDFTTYISPGGKIKWVSGDNIKSFKIRIDSGMDIFEDLPANLDNVNCFAKMANKRQGEAKYSIIYTTKFSNKSFTIDPKLRLKEHA